MRLAVRGIDSEFVNLVRSGGNDANGQRALLTKAVGQANPCRHCLQLIAEGDDKLVLAYRPFSALQPYAEVARSSCTNVNAKGSRGRNCQAGLPTYNLR